MKTAKALEYLDERIRTLNKYLNHIRKLQDEVLPDEIIVKLAEIELLLRGHIHQLEEKLHEPL